MTDGKHPYAADGYSGTLIVTPSSPESLKVDVEKIRKFIEGKTSSIDKNLQEDILNLLVKRSSSQRQEICQKYNEVYGKRTDLQKKLAKCLDSKYKSLIEILLQDPVFHDFNVIKNCLNSGLKGSRDDYTLAEIICTKTNSQLETLVKKVPNQNLGEHNVIAAKGQHKWSEGVKYMIRRLLSPERIESAKYTIPMNEVQEKAGKLSSKLTEICVKHEDQIDEEKFAEIFLANGINFRTIVATIQSYENDSKKPVMTIVNDNFAGPFKILMKTFLQSTQEFYAIRLNEAMNLERNKGEQNQILMRIIISRSEIDLKQILECYEKQFNDQSFIKGFDDYVESGAEVCGLLRSLVETPV